MNFWADRNSAIFHATVTGVRDDHTGCARRRSANSTTDVVAPADPHLSAGQT